MKKEVLYQINSLDKMIFRMVIQKNNIKECEIKRPTQTQMQIIEYILKQPENEVKQNELEEVLNLRRATVSGVLHTMENNGIITRVTDNSDGRVKKIILNNKAKEIFNTNKKNLKEIENIVVKDISNEDLETFFCVINKMKENIKNKME
jgi:DNA-binding MarR family transcriptional regulator